VNRVNPLYVGAFLLVLLVLAIYSLNSAKNSLRESKESFKTTQKIAYELSGLKKAYSEKKSKLRDMKRLLAQNVLKPAAIDAKFKNSGVSINSKSISKNALDFLMSKLLNSTYDIRKMRIKRLSDEKAELDLDIKW
jgi:predicted  nucleic acid-binding Zn-ribbon protein